MPSADKAGLSLISVYVALLICKVLSWSYFLQVWQVKKLKSIEMVTNGPGLSDQLVAKVALEGFWVISYPSDSCSFSRLCSLPITNFFIFQI
jgi:hypothetical protein